MPPPDEPHPDVPHPEDAGPHPDRAGPHFARLWVGRAVSDLGSAVGAVALPVVAVVTLHASTLQVTLLAVASAVAGALAATPLGALAEHRRKRPVMVLADLLRAGTLASVAAAAAVGWLTVTQLCLVAVVNATLAIVFNAASQAHLAALVGRPGLGAANGRLESTSWLATAGGPPLGGLLVGLAGPAGALLADAVSFLASAAAVRAIRRPEPAPPPRAGRRREPLVGGWRFLLGHRALRRCLASYVLFAGTIALLSPLETLFLLRDLHAHPWAYGLVVGLPCLAGLAGARSAPSLIARWGPVRALRRAAWWRAPWMLLLPLAQPGTGGLLLAATAYAGLLGAAAVHNTALTTYRQLSTPDPLLTRAATAWSAAVRLAQPPFILAGGLFAARYGVRAGLWLGAVVLVACALPLPGAAPAAGETGGAPAPLARTVGR